MSKILFALATAIIAYGVIQNVKIDGVVASTGAMAMNSFYLLAIAAYAASAAAALIWPSKSQ